MPNFILKASLLAIVLGPNLFFCQDESTFADTTTTTTTKNNNNNNKNNNDNNKDQILASAQRNSRSSGSSGKYNNNFNNSIENFTKSHKKHGSIHVAQWNYDYVSAPFIFTGFVLLIGVIKIVYHHIKPLAASLPESCLLIILGLLLGCLLLVEHADKTLSFLTYDARSFFLFLLPPIILEAAYSLRDRAFVENVGTILLFAVVGTLLNIFLVGPALYIISQFGFGHRWLDISILECLIFSSLIAAVDPVAVLAIFQEVGVNKMLYFMVFGESLFNDAVTVVIYNMMVSFLSIERIAVSDLFVGLAAFVCVSVGGIIIGIFFGFLTCIITKYSSHVRVVEPVIFFTLAYLSYLTAEMVHFSGIISIICCGILQGYYAMENISSKSYISIVYFSKVTSSVMESLIFIILGVMLVNQTDVWKAWSTSFTFWSLIFCLSFRFIVVFGISFLINLFLKGIRRVSYEEQFIMAYGGLRGAISFSLVFMLDQELAPSKNTLLTTTYFIILFTVFLQGISIKPLVRLMRIKLDVQDSSIFKEINRAMIGNILAGVEEIVGHKGTHYWTAVAKHVSQTVVRPVVQSNPHKKSSNLMQLYQERAIQQQLSMSASQVDVPKLAALWNELDMLDDTSASVSTCGTILQAQDDYSKDLVSPNVLVAGRRSKSRGEEKISALESREIFAKVRIRPPSLSLDSPKELLLFRDMLQSPAHKTLHYTFDKDLVSPSRQMFVDSMTHITKERLKRKRSQPYRRPGTDPSSSYRGNNSSNRFLNVHTTTDHFVGDSSAKSPAIITSIPEANEEMELLITDGTKAENRNGKARTSSKSSGGDMESGFVNTRSDEDEEIISVKEAKRPKFHL